MTRSAMGLCPFLGELSWWTGLVAAGEELGSGLGRQERGDLRLGQGGVLGWVAVKTLHIEGATLFDILDAGGVMRGAEGAAGIVTLFLEDSDFAVEPAEDVDHLGKGWQVAFDVVGAGGFLEENLRKPGGGGLEADFGQFGSILAAEMIDQVILVQAVLDDQVLFGAPFEVAAGGPIGDIAFGDACETGIVEGGDDVLVRDPVLDHAVDHVALDFWK